MKRRGAAAMRRRVGHFPPRSAGASLKRMKVVTGEALTVNFPPRSAGASLKLPLRTDRGGTRTDFPPRSAGASLKLLLEHRNDPAMLVTFPRVLRGPH